MENGFLGKLNQGRQAGFRSEAGISPKSHHHLPIEGGIVSGLSGGGVEVEGGRYIVSM